MDDARSRAHAMKTAIEMVQVEVRQCIPAVSVCLSVHLSVCLSLHLSRCPLRFLTHSMCVFIDVCVCVCVFIDVCVCVCARARACMCV